MQLSHLFEISPFLALSFCVCLATVAWCIILLRRGCHHIADRALIGFIGLLSVYQSIQILRRGGVLTMPHLHHLDEAVDLLVNSLYLLAALLLRMSNHDRFETIFRLRLAEAEQVPCARGPRWDGHAGDLTVVERLRSAAPQLSAHALKLYVYVCFNVERHSGMLEASEEELVQYLSGDRKALLASFKELRERHLCDIDIEPSNRPVRIVASPVRATPERALV